MSFMDDGRTDENGPAAHRKNRSNQRGLILGSSSPENERPELQRLPTPVHWKSITQPPPGAAPPSRKAGNQMAPEIPQNFWSGPQPLPAKKTPIGDSHPEDHRHGPEFAQRAARPRRSSLKGPPAVTVRRPDHHRARHPRQNHSANTSASPARSLHGRRRAALLHGQ